MLGYSLHRYTSNGYDKVGITMYFESYGWRPICQIGWQRNTTGDWGTDYFYGFDIEMTKGLNSLGFEEYLKFGNRIKKDGTFGYGPQDFVEWLVSLHGCKRIIRDPRLREEVIYEDYMKSLDKICYRVKIGQSYIFDVLANDESDAENKAIKRLVDENKLDYVKQWGNNGGVYAYYPGDYAYGVSIDEWLKIY